jgi:hypothetical protein
MPGVNYHDVDLEAIIQQFYMLLLLALAQPKEAGVEPLAKPLLQRGVLCYNVL